MPRSGHVVKIVRFFCSIDASADGLVALAYTDLMLAAKLTILLAATRVATFQSLPPQGKGWARHHGLFLTPFDSKNYVNVVCGDALDWRRLWTANVRNVIITGYPPPPDLADQEAALKFDLIIVHGGDLLEQQWKDVGATTAVIPLGTERSDAIRRAILG